MTPFTVLGGNSENPSFSQQTFTVPANTPVFVIATVTTPGDEGTASMTVEQANDQIGNLVALIWSGINSPTIANPTPTPSGGASQTPMTMLHIDIGGFLTLQVVNSNSFDVENTSSNGASGFIWMIPAP